MDGKHTALQDRIGGDPSVIRNVKFLNLCLLRTVFQGIGILPLGLHGSLGSIGPLLICFWAAALCRSSSSSRLAVSSPTLSGPSYCPTNTLL